MRAVGVLADNVAQLVWYSQLTLDGCRVDAAEHAAADGLVAADAALDAVQCRAIAASW